MQVKLCLTKSLAGARQPKGTSHGFTRMKWMFHEAICVYPCPSVVLFLSGQAVFRQAKPDLRRADNV